MNKKKITIITIILVSIIIFVMDFFNKESFVTTNKVFNWSHDGFYVNDFVIFITEPSPNTLPSPYIINKKTGLGMDLGLDMKEKIDNSDPFVVKSYFVNHDNVYETYQENNDFILAKYDLKSYSKTSTKKRIKYEVENERVPYYSSSDGLNLFGNSNMRTYYDKQYSIIASDFYIDGKKISIKPLLNQNFSVDGNEVFYLANDFSIYSYYKGETQLVIEDADNFLITKDYLYYSEKNGGDTIKVNRNRNYEVENRFPVDSAIKVLDYQEYTYILEWGELHVYYKDEKVKTFIGVNGFDIDDSYIYTYTDENSVDRINLITLEREEFWHET